MQPLLLAQQHQNVIILIFRNHDVALAVMVEIRHGNAMRSVAHANRRVSGGSDRRSDPRWQFPKGSGGAGKSLRVKFPLPLTT